ncbi:MAG: class III signal peptide-containing protein [Methanobacterium sp.]|nr:MAG: class III signal peptide-containing protein [Methanobacterium sp.]
MLFIIDEKGQGSAELILIFGGMIVIVIVAAIYYQNYLSRLGDEIIKTDVENVTNQINNLTKKF